MAPLAPAEVHWASAVGFGEEERGGDGGEQKRANDKAFHVFLLGCQFNKQNWLCNQPQTLVWTPTWWRSHVAAWSAPTNVRPMSNALASHMRHFAMVVTLCIEAPKAT